MPIHLLPAADLLRHPDLRAGPIVDARRRRAFATGHMPGAVRRGRLPPLVDTRSPPEFQGEIDAYLPRRGRLPGATLAPFAEVFEEGGRYAGSAGFPPRAPGTIAYCEVGVRAALFALLHEVHTGQIIPVYDGSLMEWSLHPELPLEQG